MAKASSQNNSKKPGIEKQTLLLAVMLPFATVLMVPSTASSDILNSNSRRVECLLAIQDRQRRLNEVLAEGTGSDQYRIVPYDHESSQTSPHPTFTAFTSESFLESRNRINSFERDSALTLSKYINSHLTNDPLRGPPHAS